LQLNTLRHTHTHTNTR